MSDRVLLIDDDPRLVAALKIRLEASGYEVHTAYCGEDGLAVAGRTRPHLIVLDTNMPGMKGHEVCRLIRTDPDLGATPVIVISAISHEAARHAALEAGATQFIAKPYQAMHVLAAIRAAIDKQRAKDLTGESNVSPRPEAT
jgi:DNA-binding response OmpR family regulator